MKLIEEKFGLEIKKDFYTLGDKMVDSINSYKIHFNESENDDINYRVFETMGTNTMLLTTKNENIETFFTDIVDIVTYDNSNEMLDKIEFLLQNQEMIKTISKNGYEKTILNHSFDIRAKQLIKIIEQTI